MVKYFETSAAVPLAKIQQSTLHKHSYDNYNLCMFTNDIDIENVTCASLLYYKSAANLRRFRFCLVSVCIF
jgi:hypothetical protein